MERPSTNLCSHLHCATIVKEELIIRSNVASISHESDLLYHIHLTRMRTIMAINQTITFFWISIYTVSTLEQTKYLELL